MRTLWRAGESGVADYGQSIDSDLSFWKEDVEGSIAHARMLGATGILSADDTERLLEGLEQILSEGPEELPKDVEDIHAAVEFRLHELIGETAGKLHTARSRNDQVATDAKLYLRRRLDRLSEDLKALQTILLKVASKHGRSIMPGYTHFQLAQPISLGFHYLAHFWALQRCGRRFEHVREFLLTCPLGSAALAGTRFPIDRERTSGELGFRSPTPNALDATSDRSWALDVCHAVLQLDVQVGKMASELVLWSSIEFGFVNLSDAYTTGSSIMPQKRNPDVAELIRGRSHQSLGDYASLAAMIDSLPLGYHRDYQDDKPPLFAMLSRTARSLHLMSGMLESATWNTKAMAAQSAKGFSCVTELADRLAEHGIPFREAHHLVAKIVRTSMPKGEPTLSAMRAVLKDRLPETEVRSLLKAMQPAAIVAGRLSAGSTGTSAFAAQLRRAKALQRKVGFTAIS